MEKKSKSDLALITGGTSGIGFEIARQLVLKVSKIILIYRSKEEMAVEAKENLTALNPSCIIQTLKWDLSDISSLENLFTLLGKELDGFKISYFVSCHGRIGSNLFLFKKRSEVLETINEHLMSNVLLTHFIAKEMCVNKFGRVLYLTSLASKKINRGQSDYALSKGALEIFVKSLTSEYFNRNVTFNCISAGLVNTRVSEEVKKGFEENKSEGAKIVDVFEVAKLAMHILNDPGYISGSSFQIDGAQGSIGNNKSYHRLSYKA